MRGLIWPTYSYPGNVSTDSLYLISRNLILVNPEIHWHLVVPDWENKRRPDELDDCEWASLHPTPMQTQYRTQESTMDVPTLWKFAPQEGEIPVDFVVQMSPQRTMNMANAWSIRCHENWRPVMVNYDLLQRDDRNKEYVADEMELMQCAAGFWAGDLNVHESPICEWMTYYNARRYLASAQVQRIKDRSVLIEQGVPVGRLDAALKGPKRDKFTMFYGGRFADSKRFGELAEIIDAAYRFGREMDFVVCTGSLASIEEAKFRERFPQVELHVGTNQYEAWQLMSECHAAVCFSRGELFGLMFWEQIAAGLATVMKAEFWNEDMLPEEYPLWVNTKDEAYLLVSALYKQYQNDPQAFERQWSTEGEWAQYVRGRYDADKNMRTMAYTIRDEVDARVAKLERGWSDNVGQEFLLLMEESLEEGITLPELIKALRKNSRIGRGVAGIRMSWGQSLGTLDICRMAQFLGWRQKNQTEVEFTKEQA